MKPTSKMTRRLLLVTFIAGIGAFLYAFITRLRVSANPEAPPKLALQPFLNRYHPDATAHKADDELLARYAKLVPVSLLELWKHAGFGTYSNGLITLVNPDDYLETLYGWLMRDLEDDEGLPDRIPVALSSFGRMFYYRRLSAKDEDVSMLDPNDSGVEVLNWSLESFFNEFLCDAASADNALQTALHREAVVQHGALTYGQMYAWTPALRLGGDQALERVRVVDAQVHLDILLQLALE